MIDFKMQYDKKVYKPYHIEIVKVDMFYGVVLSNIKNETHNLIFNLCVQKRRHCDSCMFLCFRPVRMHMRSEMYVGN